MLKTRIVGVLVLKNSIVVQSIGFKKYLPVGSPAISVEYLNRWGIDEISLLDIDATPKGTSPDLDSIREWSRHCQVPLAIGGGIKDVESMRKVIYAGADKVIMNTAATQRPKLISEGARLLGNQCVVVSIDARKKADGCYEIFTNSGTTSTGLDPATFARVAEEHGAGEILLNSIDRDGSKLGYDLELIGQVVDAVHIPVIVCGGVGNPAHFKEALSLDVSALAAANFFHYTEHSVITTKSYLSNSDKNIRLDTYASYENYSHGYLGRASKLDDSTLEHLRFEYIPEEII